MRRVHQRSYFTPREVERRLGISRQRLTRFRREGDGPCYFLTRHGLVLYPTNQWRRRRR